MDGQQQAMMFLVLGAGILSIVGILVIAAIEIRRPAKPSGDASPEEPLSDAQGRRGKAKRT